MKFCKECGKQLKDGAQFCNSCGTGIAEEEKTQDRRQEAVKPKQKMSFKTKIIISSAIIFIILLFAGYKTGEALTSHDRLIDKFEEAIVEKDADALANVLSTNDKKLEIDKKSVAGLITYFEENPDELPPLVSSLRTDAMALENGSTAETSSPIHMELDGRKFVYDNYEINVQPTYLTIYTNYKDTVLSLNDEEIGTADTADYEKTFGPFVPGEYEAAATLATDFIDLSTTETVSLFDYTMNEQYASLTLDGEDVTMDLSSVQDANLAGTLFINGTDTGVDPFSTDSFGPVLTDGTMNMSIKTELPWGEITSSEVPIDTAYMSVNLLNEDVQQQLIDQVMAFNDEYLAAATSGDMEKLTTADSSYKDGIEDMIQSDLEYGYYYSGSFLSSTFYLDSIYLYYMDGKWKASLDTTNNYNEDNFYEGESPEREETSTDYSYTLVYDEDDEKWLVDGFDYSYFYSYSDGETKDVTNEEPTVYTSNQEAKAETEAETSDGADDTAALETLMDEYLTSLIEAINNNSFSTVSSYLQEDSELYTSQQDLVDNLSSKSITEELNDYTINETDQAEDEATISTTENITINYSDGTSETNDYDWSYTAVKNGDGDWQLTSIE